MRRRGGGNSDRGKKISVVVLSSLECHRVVPSGLEYD